MRTGNPYNINTQENEYLAYQEGYQCSLTIESNPYDEVTDAKLARIWEKGYKANPGRPKADPQLTLATPTPPQENAVEASKSALNGQSLPPLSSYSSEAIFKEAGIRLEQAKELLNKAKKLFG